MKKLKEKVRRFLHTKRGRMAAMLPAMVMALMVSASASETSPPSGSGVSMEKVVGDAGTVFKGLSGWMLDLAGTVASTPILSLFFYISLATVVVALLMSLAQHR